MKICFSTLAAPEMEWSDILAAAKDFGFGGVELRGLGKEINAAKCRQFQDANINKTLADLKSKNLKIPCISGSECFREEKFNGIAYTEAVDNIALAKKIGTPLVRVLADCGQVPDGEFTGDNFKNAKDSILKLLPIAEQNGVCLVVETNAFFSNTKNLHKLIEQVLDETSDKLKFGPFLGVLWDLHHPYRYNNESPKETLENIGEYLKFVHAKDSVLEDGKIVYKLAGEGDLPLTEMFETLLNYEFKNGSAAQKGYDGYISLEWLKRWKPDIENAGIVIPAFANYMKKFVAYGKKLYADNRNTGFYPYRKESLINETFPDVLDRICESFPEQYAFKYTEPDIDYVRTYPEFRDDVDAFAASLIAMGVKKGDHVAIWATNVPAWFITFHAAVKIGAVLVTVNTAYKIHEAEYLLSQSDTHTLILIDGFKDSNYAEIIQEIRHKLPRLKNIVTAGFAFGGNNNTAPSEQYITTFDEALEVGCKILSSVPEGELSPVEFRRSEINVNDVCNMQYTSGTTGFPKGVMLTHYNVVNNGKAIGDCMDFSSADSLMIQVPMFHCFGMVLAMTAAMTHAATMSPISSFSPRKGLEAIRKEKITAFHGVPTMFIAMLEHPDFAKTDFSNLRTGIMAGSPCPEKVMRDVVEKMNMSEICITYGQTECSPAATMSKTSDTLDVRCSTVGTEIFGVEVKIINPGTGEILPDETDGELCVRGYNVMRGYYKMREATAAAIDKDGWLHTGDLARRTPDNSVNTEKGESIKYNYKITGRIKDMLIRGGENIYPKEIEDFLYTHPAVKDVQVVGAPDKVYGEEIFAFVILRDAEKALQPNLDVLKDEIKAFAREKIAKHKVPRYIEFVESFPMNAAGKILKYKMREDATAIVAGSFSPQTT